MSPPDSRDDANAKLLDRSGFGLGRTRGRWLKWALILGFWTFFGLLLSGQAYVGALMNDRPIPFGQSLLRHMPWAYTWAAFTPVILWLRVRFKFDRRSWPTSLAVHLPATLLITLIGDVVFVGSGQLAGVYPAEIGAATSLVIRIFISFFHMDPFIYWVILGLGYAAQYYRESRERQIRASQLAAQLAQARLRALEMQLHPHFLFNALHTIGTLVRTNQNKLAIRVVAGLGELLRRALEEGGSQLVPLKQELEFIERYLEIEQIRFRDRLKVEMKIDPETLDASVPRLILQPLVENAIRHGIATRASAQLLEITAQLEDANLRLQVRDDGPGLPEPWETEARDGVGLSTTRARLRQLYGDDHAFEVRNAEGGGTMAGITIPFWPARDEEEERELE